MKCRLTVRVRHTDITRSDHTRHAKMHKDMQIISPLVSETLVKTFNQNHDMNEEHVAEGTRVLFNPLFLTDAVTVGLSFALSSILFQFTVGLFKWSKSKIRLYSTFI